ncbi:MaoC family dehydratase [Nocardioides hungaricus]
MVRIFENLEALKAVVGQELGSSPWVTVTQADIDDFARLTKDEQWIHVDRARAAAGPFGSTIVHGYLVMSLIAYFSDAVYTVEGLESSLNYGSDRVRFPSPVPVDSRLRGVITLVQANELESGTQLVTRVVVERSGDPKPACVADVVYLMT